MGEIFNADTLAGNLRSPLVVLRLKGAACKMLNGAGPPVGGVTIKFKTYRICPEIKAPWDTEEHSYCSCPGVCCVVKLLTS